MRTHTALFMAGLLLPLLIALAGLLWVRRRRTVAARLGDRRLAGRIAGEDLHAIPWRRLVPVGLASLLLGAALALPVDDPDEGAAGAGGRDVVLVLDASNSMRVEDVSPNRLEQQRLLALRLLRELRDDRVGVVAFAGDASVLTPPTRDHAAVEMFLNAVRPEIAVQTGTAIAAGLRQATSLLAAAPERPGTRIAILLSDGEPLEPDAQRDATIAAARRAAALGVVVHTVGIGTERGGPVPDVDHATGRRLGFKTDPVTGATAVSALDAALLREVARQSRGTYHHLTDVATLNALIGRIAAAERSAGGPGGHFHAPTWLIAGALLLLAGDTLAERRRERPSG